MTNPEQHAFETNVGKDIVLGIRPEHFSHAGFTAATPTMSTIKATVKVVELMGDHQYVYLNLAGLEQPVVMKCNSHHRAAPGQEIEVHADCAVAHVFAGTDEKAVNITLAKGFDRIQG
jgi:ABC-type sugar transport system ATPase subunit